MDYKSTAGGPPFFDFSLYKSNRWDKLSPKGTSLPHTVSYLLAFLGMLLSMPEFNFFWENPVLFDGRCADDSHQSEPPVLTNSPNSK